MFINIKYAYYGLAKKWISSLMAVVLFSICFTFLYFIIRENSNVNKEVDRVTSIFQDRFIYAVELYDDLGTYTNEETMTSLRKLLVYLQNYSNITHIYYSDEEISVENFKGIDNFLTFMGADDDFTWVRGLNIDDSFMEEFNFEIKEGRNFNYSDFTIKSNEAMPIILGSAYKDYFEINDELKYFNRYGGGIRKLQVVGFLKENYYFIGGYNNEYLPINLDSYVIYPIQSPENTIGIEEDHSEYQRMKAILEMRNLRSSIIVINEENQIVEEEVIKEINETIKELELQNMIQLRNLTENTRNLVDNFNRAVREHKIIVYIAIFFTSIGMISSGLSSIKRRYKEFGVHISYGCSKKDIARRIFYENGLIALVAIVISCILVIFINNSYGMATGTAIAFIPLMILIGFAITLVIVVSIPPFLKILKSDPTNLIKR